MRGMSPWFPALLLVALASCAGGAMEDAGTSGTLTEGQTLRLLNDQGYKGVHDLHRVGDQWEAAATRDGQAVTVDVDNYGIIHIK